MNLEQPLSVTPVYTVEEVLENFTALLGSMDFPRELAVFGVKRLQFGRRRGLLLELHALTVALWRLALLRSFPDDAESIFETFLAQSADFPEQSRRARQAQAFNERVRFYVELLHEKGDGDFMVVSKHLVGNFKTTNADAAAQSLRLALLIRNNYTTIFDRLI